MISCSLRSEAQPSVQSSFISRPINLITKRSLNKFQRIGSQLLRTLLPPFLKYTIFCPRSIWSSTLQNRQTSRAWRRRGFDKSRKTYLPSESLCLWVCSQFASSFTPTPPGIPAKLNPIKMCLPFLREHPSNFVETSLIIFVTKWIYNLSQWKFLICQASCFDSFLSYRFDVDGATLAILDFFNFNFSWSNEKKVMILISKREREIRFEWVYPHDDAKGAVWKSVNIELINHKIDYTR